MVLAGAETASEMPDSAGKEGCDAPHALPGLQGHQPPSGSTLKVAFFTTSLSFLQQSLTNALSPSYQLGSEAFFLHFLVAAAYLYPGHNLYLTQTTQQTSA